MRKLGLGRGIITIFSANLVNMIFNIFINFAQPKFLPISSYAAIKTFQLYGSYVGILHLGYIDGMYLKYGGKSIQDIKEDDLYSNISTLRVFQTAIEVISLLFALLIRNDILIFFSLSILPLNMAGYFKSLYQATGEFSKYSRIMNFNTFSAFSLNVLLILVLKDRNYQPYLLLYVVSYLFIWLYFEKQFKKRFNYTSIYYKKFNFNLLTSNIKNGILLMFGNLSSTILISMDRWFVKFLMDTEAFAQYSFAVSMESFLNIAITPVTITLYNYFCINNNDHQIKKMRNYVTIFAVFLPSAAFPAKFILQTFLKSYISADGIMFYLFASQTFYILVTGIYVNLYKAREQQAKYFTKLIIILVLGFLINILFYKLIPIKESFAIGTVVTLFIWFVLSERDFSEIKFGVKKFTYIILSVILLIFLGISFDAFSGFALYILIMASMTYYVFHDETKEAWIAVKKQVKDVL